MILPRTAVHVPVASSLLRKLKGDRRKPLLRLHVTFRIKGIEEGRDGAVTAHASRPGSPEFQTWHLDRLLWGSLYWSSYSEKFWTRNWKQVLKSSFKNHRIPLLNIWILDKRIKCSEIRRPETFRHRNSRSSDIVPGYKTRSWDRLSWFRYYAAFCSHYR